MSTEPEYHVSQAPSGVWVTSETDDRVAQPVPFFDDWWRWGVVSFLFESYRMWADKCWAAIQPQWRARQIKAKKEAARATKTEQESGKVGTL